jgi:hypothetical protein
MPLLNVGEHASNRTPKLRRVIWLRNGSKSLGPPTPRRGGMFMTGARGVAEEPYINHLLEVATLVAHATQGKDPELVVAALLHDAIEDQEVPASVVADNFGNGVAKLVQEVTDNKKLTKKKRK